MVAAVAGTVQVVQVVVQGIVDFCTHDFPNKFIVHETCLSFLITPGVADGGLSGFVGTAQNYPGGG